MPPKARITREMIIDAAFALARSEGAEAINARTVSERLGCSTQPVMYHFATIEDLKKAVYAKLDRFHSEYLMRGAPSPDGPMLGIGLNYIRFAIEEPQLFRFLFQSGFAAGNSLLEMIESEALRPILSAVQEDSGLNAEQAEEVFVSIALFAHGYASMFANHTLAYDEEMIAAHLERAYLGAILAVRQQEAQAQASAAKEWREREETK